VRKRTGLLMDKEEKFFFFQFENGRQ